MTHSFPTLRWSDRLGSVWQTRAFELAGLEEARDENLEPFSDRGEIISTTFGFRKSNRPFTQFVIAPRLPGQEGDFCRAHALSTDIVKKEVVQDRKSVVQGKRVSVRVDLVGCSFLKTK